MQGPTPGVGQSSVPIQTGGLEQHCREGLGGTCGRQMGHWQCPPEVLHPSLGHTEQNPPGSRAGSEKSLKAERVEVGQSREEKCLWRSYGVLLIYKGGL